MRSILTVLACGALLAGLTSCSSDDAAQPPAAQPPANLQADLPQLVQAAFTAPEGAQLTAVTYNAEMVPVGAKVTVSAKADGTTTKVKLVVSGLMANHQFGAHVHTKKCGVKPADSGPHYQDKKDPVTPSVDPAFANAQNEIWLDFTADAKGDATADSTVNWVFRPGEANAVVLHASHTSTEHGKAGTAGDRLACVTAAF